MGRVCILGTWLLDLKSQHPDQNWELHGVDIGSSLFPPRTSELELRQHDIKACFPPAWGWHDHFDVIHQRLLIWGLPESVWPLVLRNQHDALKPGGWIQLVEAEWIDPMNPHRLPELYKHSLMQQWSTSTFGMDIHIAYKLEGMLKDAGFVNVQKTQFTHGYGALAHSPAQANPSAELYVECFRSVDAKMPPGMCFAFPLLFCIYLFSDCADIAQPQMSRNESKY
jgi:SAM-dependent methyltransferase